MTDTLSTFVGTIWTWLNADQNAGAVSALLAVLTLAGGAGGWLWRRKSKAAAPDQTGGNHVSASTGDVGAGGSMTGNTITTNHGATPEQIAAIFAGVRDLSQSSEAKAIATADQFGTISREALTSFFTILRHEQVPPEQLTAKLTSIALQYREMVDRLTALEETASPDDRPKLAEVRTTVEKGDYDYAESLLVTLENAQAAARATAQASADDLARRQAATRAERARLSALRFDHRAAANHFLAAANLLRTGDTEGRCNYLINSADALRQYGEERGDSAALHTAITRYREALPPRDLHPDLWACVQNNLGNALSILGAREGNNAFLLEAVDAYANASLEYTRARTPLDWAGVQNNLGSALKTLGEREGDKSRVQQAVNAYENALLEWDRKKVPLDWAGVQNNLGNALVTLGIYEDNGEIIEKAIDAYHAALLERTRDHAPTAWATTQNNLGTALQTIGERESDSPRLQKAVDAYNHALLERTRNRFPLDWATTQSNLGTALHILGELEDDSSLLWQAVDAYNNALLEQTRDRTPLDWARVQTNMGNALQRLAKLTQDTHTAKQAICAQETALEMFTRLDAPYYITVATNNLAIARATLAKLESSAVSPPHQ